MPSLALGFLCFSSSLQPGSARSVASFSVAFECNWMLLHSMLHFLPANAASSSLHSQFLSIESVQQSMSFRFYPRLFEPPWQKQRSADVTEGSSKASGLKLDHFVGIAKGEQESMSLSLGCAAPAGPVCTLIIGYFLSLSQTTVILSSWKEKISGC